MAQLWLLFKQSHHAFQTALPTCLSLHTHFFFFFETWRIAIRQFQVVWVPEDNHILEPLEASHTHSEALQSSRVWLSHLYSSSCHVNIPFSFHRFFTPFPPVMSTRPYNHTKNSVRKQPPRKTTQRCAEPTFCFFVLCFFFQHLIAVMCYIFQ